jgi:hypothetical protein
MQKKWTDKKHILRNFHCQIGRWKFESGFFWWGEGEGVGEGLFFFLRNKNQLKNLQG